MGGVLLGVLAAVMLFPIVFMIWISVTGKRAAPVIEYEVDDSEEMEPEEEKQP